MHMYIYIYIWYIPIYWIYSIYVYSVIDNGILCIQLYKYIIYIWIEHIFYVQTVYGCIGLKYVLNIHMEHTHKSLQKLQYKTGWWYTYPSETYEFVSWDDEIPNMMGNIIQMFQSPPTSIVDHSWFFVDEVGFVQWDWSGKITPTTVVTV